MNKLQEKDKNIMVKWLDQFTDTFIATKTEQIDIYIEKIKEQNPNISQINLAKKIRNKKSLNNGLVGAVTSIGGIITLPVTVPADLIATWKIQIALIYAIAKIFGYSDNDEYLKTDIYLILAGKKAYEAFNEIGINKGDKITKKALKKHLFREISGRILRIIPQKIIARAGEKSVSHFMKLVPLAGAPFGFAFDYIETRSIGSNAIKYYSE
ncbi:MAG: EcsC family protein [Bacteroidales bacterium]|nr:EcsC family protein [Bacteroidales bacterium]